MRADVFYALLARPEFKTGQVVLTPAGFGIIRKICRCDHCKSLGMNLHRVQGGDGVWGWWKDELFPVPV